MDRPSWTEDDGAPAAHEIGAELARADYDLFVYSSAQRFVERDVVAGIQYRRLPGNTEAEVEAAVRELVELLGDAETGEQ
ncbi:hypothetical protein IU498_09310 [Nocardia beijingensis]|uniref:hypothetical protein n=1 Tax=Nocardia beijingensis TaxID=95162 RepID=UPI0018935A6B|nr:hypothetical protein [Nocardia beijingensis]MBF6074824.1 hypothetical protein [Nocardia beijingensis]